MLFRILLFFEYNISYVVVLPDCQYRCLTVVHESVTLKELLLFTLV